MHCTISLRFTLKMEKSASTNTCDSNDLTCRKYRRAAYLHFLLLFKSKAKLLRMQTPPFLFICSYRLIPASTIHQIWSLFSHQWIPIRLPADFTSARFKLISHNSNSTQLTTYSRMVIEISLLFMPSNWKHQRFWSKLFPHIWHNIQ